MKPSFFIANILIATALFLTGCSSTFENLTPAKGPQNPSGIYTMKMKPHIHEDILESSINPQIVINGQTHSMQLEPTAGAYVYDYEMPEEQNHVSYYYQLDYKKKLNGGYVAQQKTSDLYSFKVKNRYVHGLDAERGPVGAKIAIVGRGFSPEDIIKVGDVTAESTFISPSTLLFTIPLIQPKKAYPVRIENENSALHAGSLYIDASSFKTSIQSIELVSGDSLDIQISIPSALAVDLPISITTDIPEHILMDPLTISAGNTDIKTTLDVEGRASGTIYLNATGFNEIRIPVIVIEKTDVSLQEDSAVQDIITIE